MLPNADRSITLRWEDRSGTPCADCAAPLGHTIDQVGSAYSGTAHTALWYSFNATETSVVRIDAAAGISRFWFEVDDGAGAGVRIENQSGKGFALQDTVMVANSTCLDVANGRTATLDIAVIYFTSAFFWEILIIFSYWDRYARTLRQAACTLSLTPSASLLHQR